MKPGTRCECRDEKCPVMPFPTKPQHGNSSAPMLACGNDAVRLVTVTDEVAEDRAIREYNRAMAAWTRKGMHGTKAAVDSAQMAVHAARNRQVALCAACAEHAAKAVTS